MKVWKAYMRFWQKYTDIRSLSSRMDYWVPMVINMLVLLSFWLYGLYDVVVYLMSVWMGAQAGFLFEASMGVSMDVQTPLLLTLVFLLAIMTPTITLFIRRMHDTGASANMFWLSLIPLVGVFFQWVVFLLMFVPHGGYHSNLLAWKKMPLRELDVNYPLTWLWILSGVMTVLTICFLLFVFPMLLQLMFIWELSRG